MLLLIAILSLSSIVSARPTNASDKQCRIGNASFPIPIFESYAGWECHEETYGRANELTVHVCVETSGGEDYSVPCFKSNGRMLSFNLKNEESVTAILESHGSRQLNEDMIRCYLSVVAACEISRDGWLEVRGGCGRSFVTNSTECGLEGQNKFHIAMLSISLIIGIPILVAFVYCHVLSRSWLLSHCRNLLTALILRTLFTLLIETEVVPEMIRSRDEAFANWAGCEALAAFETISLNFVLAYWLILTFYLFEYSKNGFRERPDIRKGSYIVLGISATFALIWIIIMAAGGYGHCWLERTPVQWVNDSLRFCFIILQIFLTAILWYRVVTSSDSFHGDPDSEHRLLLTTSLFLVIASPLFFLQFSLSASHPVEPEGSDPHIYTEFFFDGLQCGIVSSLIFWLSVTVISDFCMIRLREGFLSRGKPCHRVFETAGGSEVEIRQGDAPPRVSARLTPSFVDEERKDVTYTSVLTPERFERTIKLYNRLNVIPKQGESLQQDNSSVKSEYFDVDNDSVNTVYNEVTTPTAEETKNVYYNSRYLVHDSESSASEESVVATVDEPKPDASSSSSSDSEILPPEGVDASREIEEWLRDCQSEFQDYAEKAARNKSRTAIHRSLSGSILTGSEIPGSVKVELRSESVRARNGSAPSVMTSEEEDGKKGAEELPSIYDDLKDFTRPRNPRPPRKRDYSADWCNYRNRVLDKRRRVRSVDGLDDSLEGVTSPGLDLRGGSLKVFSAVEDLTQLGDSSVCDRTENSEQQRNVEVKSLSDDIHVKI